jgi:hypothetical protein
MLGSKKTIIVYFLMWAGSVIGGQVNDEKYPKTPDITQTPGDLCTVSSPDFKEYRYDEKIPYCFRDVSSATKKLVYQNYKIPNQDVRNKSKTAKPRE